MSDSIKSSSHYFYGFRLFLGEKTSWKRDFAGRQSFASISCGCHWPFPVWFLGQGISRTRTRTRTRIRSRAIWERPKCEFRVNKFNIWRNLPRKTKTRERNAKKGNVQISEEKPTKCCCFVFRIFCVFRRFGTLWAIKGNANAKANVNEFVTRWCWHRSSLCAPVPIPVPVPVRVRVPISLCKNPEKRHLDSSAECSAKWLNKTSGTSRETGCLYITDFHFVNKHLPSAKRWRGLGIAVMKIWIYCL